MQLKVIVTEVIGIRPLHLVTPVGIIPEMPQTVTAIYNTGEEETITVTWDKITEAQVEKTGKFTVKGTVGTMEAEAVVRVAEAVNADGKNIAVKSKTYPVPSASWVQPNGNDPVSAINNGKIYYSGGPAGERWIA